MNNHLALRIQYIQSLFENHPKLFETEKYPEVVSIEYKGTRKIKATLPLKDHPLYNETVLCISETYDAFGNIATHHYGWELSQRLKKSGKQPRHIMAFGNEWKEPNTPAWVTSNPFHHHHIPGDPGKRKSTTVKNIEATINILTDYINGGITYHSTHSF